MLMTGKMDLASLATFKFNEPTSLIEGGRLYVNKNRSTIVLSKLDIMRVDSGMFSGTIIWIDPVKEPDFKVGELRAFASNMFNLFEGKIELTQEFKPGSR